jgi:hypothetical protein
MPGLLFFHEYEGDTSVDFYRTTRHYNQEDCTLDDKLIYVCTSVLFRIREFRVRFSAIQAKILVVLLNVSIHSEFYIRSSSQSVHLSILLNAI